MGTIYRISSTEKPQTFTSLRLFSFPPSPRRLFPRRRPHGLRPAYPVIPPKVEYSLTPPGREAAERLAVPADWIEDNYPRIAAGRAPQSQP